MKTVQSLYDRITNPRWDSAGYRIKHEATRADLDAQMAAYAQMIVARKAEIDAGVASGRNPVVIDEMRRGFIFMAETYDEVSDAIAELDGARVTAAAE